MTGAARMTRLLGHWTLALDGTGLPDRELIGGKAWSVARMRSLGFHVPPAFVVTTRACTAYFEKGGFPDGLEHELAAGISWLEAQAHRRFGVGPSPLLVSVRSGAPVSMPGMMDTILNLGMTELTEQALAAECGDPAFARDTRRRFLDLYAQIVLRTSIPPLDPAGEPPGWRDTIAAAAGQPVPEDAVEQLRAAVRAVFESWNSRRARRYRQHHGIPEDLGTAVTVQAMVFGNVDERSGTGVLFTRNPLTGERRPFGEFLARAQGEDIVSGKFTPKPIEAMREGLPDALEALFAAGRRLEELNLDVQDIEFTVERGRLFLLQSRAAKLAPLAAVRVAVEMVREGLIDEAGALRRLVPDQIRVLLSPQLTEAAVASAVLAAQGEGACPGVGSGVVVTSADEAERRGEKGEAVVLARPTTSPEDLHGMIAARAVITEQGGSTSHAAVVSRALGRACVVGCGPGTLHGLVGRTVTADGKAGRVYHGALEVEIRDERTDPLLATVARWAEARAPLEVHRPSAGPVTGTVDLDPIDDAADPRLIGQVLAGLGGAKGARGGAIASDEGVRAALAAGLRFIVAEPVLPPLLVAARAALEAAPAGSGADEPARPLALKLVRAPPRVVNGVTDAEIVFGMASPFSGATKELGRAMKAGYESAFAAINEVGGVNGRRLRLTAIDDHYDPDRTRHAMKELVEDKKVFAVVGNVGSATAAVSIPYVLEKKVVFFGALSGAAVLRRSPPDRYVFNYRPSYDEETAAAVRYLVGVRKLRPEQIAVFHQDDDFGEAGVLGVARQLREYGHDPGHSLKVTYRRNTADVWRAVARLRAEGSRLRAVVMVATYSAAAQFILKMKESARTELVFTNVSAVDSNALAELLVQAGPGFTSDVVVTQVVPPPHSSSTAILKYQDALQRHALGEPPGFLSLEGYINGMILAEALSRAGRDLDTERLVEALEGIQGLDLGIGTPITFGPSEHQGSHRVWGTVLEPSGNYCRTELE
jgi:pyruvate,orthophosphate dikinase